MNPSCILRRFLSLVYLLRLGLSRSLSRSGSYPHIDSARNHIDSTHLLLEVDLHLLDVARHLHVRDSVTIALPLAQEWKNEN